MPRWLSHTVPIPCPHCALTPPACLQAELAKARVDAASEQSKLSARIKELESEVTRALAAGQADAQSQTSQVSGSESGPAPMPLPYAYAHRS